jgi:hypothetical protein
LNGPLLLLFPAAGFTIFHSVRTKNPLPAQPFIWSIALIGLYAAALPAIFDQGRYLMPLIPLIVIMGVNGLNQIVQTFLQRAITRSTVWVLLFGMVFLLWINGASDFSFRTRLFNDVHFRAAQWINDHAPENAVIATHDVGIIGYFTERPIIDLAGLVTPEIVPLMKQPYEMSEYLEVNQVRYVIVYTGYYRDLLTMLDANCVFSPNARELRAMGIEPFEIYEISQ